jgi:hypothetical protein
MTGSAEEYEPRTIIAAGFDSDDAWLGEFRQPATSGVTSRRSNRLNYDPAWLGMRRHIEDQILALLKSIGGPTRAVTLLL